MNKVCQSTDVTQFPVNPPKILGYLIRTRPVKNAGAAFKDVRYRPAGDDAVVGENDEAPANAEQTHEIPFPVAALLLAQESHCRDGIAPAAPSNEDFRHHDGQAHGEYAHQVDQNERPAAVHACDVRELPNVSQSDGGAGQGKDKGEPGGPASLRRAAPSLGCNHL